MTVTVGALCAGYGGLEIALSMITETDLRWVSETDKSASRVLEDRFGVPNLGDLTLIEDPEACDVITAGFPCQPVSVAGRREGHEDERWLIHDVVRIAEEAEAKVLILENVSGIYSANQGNAFWQVVTRLAEGGWIAEWGRFRAAQVGAPHKRERWFCVAARNADSLAWAKTWQLRSQQPQRNDWYGTGSNSGHSEPAPDSDDPGRLQHGGPGAVEEELIATKHGSNIASDSISEPTERRGDSRDMVGSQETPCDEGGRPDSGGVAFGDRSAVASDSDNFGCEGVSTGDSQNDGVDLEGRHDLDGRSVDSWGKYSVAVERWERVLGRRPPSALKEKKLNPALVEWMMGLPEGWVTSSIERRTQALRILGNGVVPQQAAAAIPLLFERLLKEPGEIQETLF